MELSAELVQSTINRLKGDQVNQQKHPRAPLRVRLKIVPYENGTVGSPIEVWTLDISCGGLSIISSMPMRTGRKFIVRLKQMDDMPLYLLCTVRNCTELAKNVFRVGSSFVEVAGRSGEIASEAHPNMAAGKDLTPQQQAQLTDEIRRVSDAVLS